MGMSYHAACTKLGVEKNTTFHSRGHREPHARFAPKVAGIPPEQWRSSARNFVMQCHKTLLEDAEALHLLTRRGLTLETIRNHSLGWWSPSFDGQFLSLPDWGLPQVFKENGHEKKLWLPSGIVIPTFSREQLVKLKIRRSDWKEGDALPKYVEVSGSMKCPAIYGNAETGAILVVEAELDALLVQQLAGDLCSSIAIGGAGKKPDFDTDRHLRPRTSFGSRHIRRLSPGLSRRGKALAMLMRWA
jgi:hypothetical protein